MKNSLLLIIAILAFACSTPEADYAEAEEAVDPNMEAFETNIETVKQLYNAFINKDFDGMRALVTDDFIWSPPQYGMDSLTVDQWEEAMRGFMENYENIEYTDDLYFASLDENQKPDGGVRTYGNWKSTYVPNGKPAAMKYYGVFIFNDEGKITTGLEWYNTADLVPADEEGDE